MSVSDFADITAYYDDSLTRSEVCQTLSLGEILDRIEKPFERWPVRNREPRTVIDSRKRAIIHERDGGICRLCGTGGHVLTVDHIIPRSTFEARHLPIADRSDNLVSACWDCNQRKSNYESIWTKRLGVVVACWYCLNPGYGEYDEPLDGLPYPVSVPVFCGRCGISNVPEIAGWVL
jgi:hypothetical protein